MSPKHLEAIRKCSCCLCHVRRGVEAHHLKQGPAAKERGLFLRATDRWSVPLCRWHHEDLERLGSRNEPAYFEKAGMDPVSLAIALWNNRGDATRMELVIVAHKQLAIRTLRRTAVINALMAHGLTRTEAEEQYTAGLR